MTRVPNSAVAMSEHHDGTAVVDASVLVDLLARLVDALYVELASCLNAPLLTTDLRLVRVCPLAEGITASIPDQLPAARDLRLSVLIRSRLDGRSRLVALDRVHVWA